MVWPRPFKTEMMWRVWRAMDSRVALYFFARSGRLEESSSPVIEPRMRGSAIGERLPDAKLGAVIEKAEEGRTMKVGIDVKIFCQFGEAARAVLDSELLQNVFQNCNRCGFRE